MKTKSMGQANRIKITRIKTPTGPSEVLRDRRTGHTIEIPLRGNSSPFVTERILTPTKTKRVCNEGTFRFVTQPSRDVPGKIVRQRFCCLKTADVDQEGQCSPRRFFVPTIFQHPKQLDLKLRDDFLKGRLQQRRVRIFRRIKEAGL